MQKQTNIKLAFVGAGGFFLPSIPSHFLRKDRMENHRRVIYVALVLPTRLDETRRFRSAFWNGILTAEMEQDVEEAPAFGGFPGFRGLSFCWMHLSRRWVPEWDCGWSRWW